MALNLKFDNKVVFKKLNEYFHNNIKMSFKTPNKIFIITKEDIFYEIHIYDDFLEPLTSFLQRHSLLTLKEDKKIKFDKELFETPKQLEDIDKFKKSSNQDYLTQFIRKMFNI